MFTNVVDVVVKEMQVEHSAFHSKEDHCPQNLH